jgi:hypothetical protein
VFAGGHGTGHYLKRYLRHDLTDNASSDNKHSAHETRRNTAAEYSAGHSADNADHIAIGYIANRIDKHERQRKRNIGHADRKFHNTNLAECFVYRDRQKKQWNVVDTDYFIRHPCHWRLVRLLPSFSPPAAQKI